MTTTDDHDPTAEATESTPPTPPLPSKDESIERLPPAPRPSQTVDQTATDQKSPILALLLALIPFGLGHLYVGLYNRAFLLFGAFWFSVYLNAAVIAVFFYFFTIIDAFRQAQIVNTISDDEELNASNIRGALSLGVFLLVVGSIMLLRNWVDINQIRFFLRDYSPVILILAGFYFIFGAIKERGQKNLDDSDF